MAVGVGVGPFLTGRSYGYGGLPVDADLLYHWRADEGVTGTSDVSAWEDQYSKVSATKPTTFFGTTELVGEGTEQRLSGGYSGGPNLATDDASTADIDWQAGATVICVGGYRASGSGTRLWKSSEDTMPAGGGGNNGNGFFIGTGEMRNRQEDDSSVFIFEQIGTHRADTVGGRYVYAVRIQDDQQQYQQNGVETDSDTDSNDAATITTAQFGMLQANEAELSEVAVYTRYLTDAEVTQVVNAMAERWNLDAPAIVSGCTLLLEDPTNDTVVTSSPDIDTWSDQSGNGNDADGGGTASFKPHLLTTGVGFRDRFEGVDFNGSSQRFGFGAGIDGAMAQLDSGRSFTIFAIIEIDSTHTGSIMSWTNANTNERNLFYVRSNLGQQKLAYSVENSTSADVYESTDTVATGETVSVAMTYDGSTNELRLYINGELDSAGAQTVTARDWSAVSNRALLGANGRGASTTDAFFNGKMVVVGFWNGTVMTSAQIEDTHARYADQGQLPRRYLRASGMDAGFDEGFG